MSLTRKQLIARRRNWLKFMLMGFLGNVQARPTTEAELPEEVTQHLHAGVNQFRLALDKWPTGPVE